MIENILRWQQQAGKSNNYQTIDNLKAAAKMLNFLQENKIMSVAGLDKKFSSLIDEQVAIQDKLKPIDRRSESSSRRKGKILSCKIGAYN